MTQTTPQHDVGFLLILAGGLAQLASYGIRLAYQRDGRQFPMFVGQIDTDIERGAGADDFYQLPLEEVVEAIEADPDVFGPETAALAKAHLEYLDPEDAGNGARTLRPLTQLAWQASSQEIALKINAWTRALVLQGGVRRVIPVILGSSGGGTGSAVQVLLPWSLRDPAFRAVALEGLSQKLLQRPILFAVEPFAMALRNKSPEANNILSNAYAYRVETAELGCRRCVKYVFHLGLSNDGGAMLDTIEESARVLGASVYGFARNWPLVKRRFVDTVDRAALDRRYLGRDVPELRLPREAHPSWLRDAGRNGANGAHGSSKPSHGEASPDFPKES